MGELADDVSGEALIEVLRMQQEQSVVFRGEAGVASAGVGAAASSGAQVSAKEVTSTSLKESLTYPATWGPSDWGPIPFLPDHDVLVQRLEKQWGNMQRYRQTRSRMSLSKTAAAAVEDWPRLLLGICW